MVRHVVESESVEWLHQKDDNSVDCIITDPPYNVSGSSLEAPDKNFSKMDETWDDYTTSEYELFCEQWLREAVRVCKPSGAIVVFGSYHNIGFVNASLQRNDMEILNEIIWFKNNAMPNLRQNRFTASHENILWATPQNDDGGSGEYTFNYDRTKEWPFDTDDHTESDKQTRSVWEIPTNKSSLGRQFDHPNQKPLRLLVPLLEAVTGVGDTVLDPFCGSGAILVAAKLVGCEYYGCDFQHDHVETARNFLQAAEQPPDSVVEQIGESERFS